MPVADENPVVTTSFESGNQRYNRSVSYAGMTGMSSKPIGVETLGVPMVKEASVEEIGSAFNGNVSFRKRKNFKLNLNLANGFSARNTTMRSSKSNLDLPSILNLAYNSPTSNVSKSDVESKTRRQSSSTTPDSANLFTVKKGIDKQNSKKLPKGKNKKENGQVCSSDIGPALAVSGNLGTSIITSKSVRLVDDELLQDLTTGAILLPTDLSDTSDSEDEYQAAQGIDLLEDSGPFEIPKCPVQHSEGKETLNAIIPCNIDQLFTMLFTNSKFYLDFHTIRKTFDINQSPWGIGPDGSKKTRQVSFTVTLSAVMGPKHSHLTETQVMLPVSKPGLFYAIDSESVNAGIPYADAFYVTVHYCLSRVSANESNLIVVNQVKYRKSVWGITKSIIEKNCWAGIEEFYNHLERALKEECIKVNLGASPIASPKLTAGSLSRRRPQKTRVKKGKAPGVPVGIPPLICQDLLRNGSIPRAKADSMMSAVHEGSQTVTEGSFALKVILSVLACLLLLNGFLYFKLARLETSTTSPIMFPPHAFTLTGEIPQNHQDWLLLLQKQEALHRIELQKWHEILMSALKILIQAESDLEALKFHISTYNGAKYSVEMLKQSTDSISSSASVISGFNELSRTNSQSDPVDKSDPNEEVVDQDVKQT